jgi:hypothetical protein
MVHNSANINKMSNHLSLQTDKHYKKKPTTNDDGLGQAQNCGRVKPVQYRYHY